MSLRWKYDIIYQVKAYTIPYDFVNFILIFFYFFFSYIIRVNEKTYHVLSDKNKRMKVRESI